MKRGTSAWRVSVFSLEYFESCHLFLLACSCCGIVPSRNGFVGNLDWVTDLCYFVCRAQESLMQADLFLSNAAHPSSGSTVFEAGVCDSRSNGGRSVGWGVTLVTCGLIDCSASLTGQRASWCVPPSRTRSLRSSTPPFPSCTPCSPASRRPMCPQTALTPVRE